MVDKSCFLVGLVTFLEEVEYFKSSAFNSSSKMNLLTGTKPVISGFLSPFE